MTRSESETSGLSESEHLGEIPEPEVDAFEREHRERRLLAKMFGKDDTTQIEHYQILREVGRGAMGVVYAARDLKLDRNVAIKKLQAQPDADRHRRLVREAKSMAMLTHPSVVPVYAISEADGAAFIVMEYIEGVTLRRWLADAHPSTADIFAAFVTAGEGLAAAHAKGLVHRDFKPDNVMVGDDGRVRVMDFGLAHSTPEILSLDLEIDVRPRGHVHVSRSAVFAGTPAYMAPEQLRGRWADPGSDQFAFCVAFYEALYGERPFAGTTVEQLLAAIERGDIREPPKNSNVPGWMRDLVVRGLGPVPHDRFASMRALLEALASGAQTHGVDTREPPQYVFVAHDSVDKLLVLKLCEDLLDRGVRPWLDIWDLRPGGDCRSHVRDVIASAPAMLLCQGRNGWGAQDHEFVAALQARFEADPSTVYRVEFPGAAEAVLSVGNSCEGVKLESSRWDDGVGELAQLIGVDVKRAKWLEYEEKIGGVSTGEFGPYRGLESFRERDARWMFGRNQEIGELLVRLRDDESHFLAVVGASGSGKSSLVMAGVCPAVRNGAMGDGRTWEVGYLRPGARPCESLAHGLLNLQLARGRQEDPVAEGMQVGELREKMLAAADTLRLVVSRIVSPRSGGVPSHRVLLVVDQLEELFTEAKLGANEGDPPEAIFGPHPRPEPGPSGAEAMAFVQNIIEATRRDGDLWVVSTLRADFLPRCLEVSQLARVLKSSTYFALPPMGEDQIRAAVVRPAKRVGFDVEAQLVEKLVVGTAGRAGRLPLLQHVLRELWQRRDAQRQSLPYVAYAETGGLEGAIATAAERALDGLRKRFGDGRAEIVTRRVMTRLVHLGDVASGDTRRRASVGELGEDDETRAVLDAFVRRARVLVAGEVDGVEVFEIAHEALLREWTTLVRWLEVDRDALRVRQELATDSAEYVAHNDREYLWGKGRVEEAKRMLGVSMVELNPVEQVFLDESYRVASRQERAAGRRRIAWMLTLAVVTVASVVVAWVMVGKNADIAEQKVAVEEKNVELERKGEELEQKDQKQKYSLSVERGLRAQMLIPENREGEALRLAVQAVGAYAPDWADPPPPEATDALERVLAIDAAIIDDSVTLRGHDDYVSAVAYSPDGSRITTASADNTARVWDPSSGKLINILGGHTHIISDVSYSPDGSHIVTASWDNTARVWSSSNGELTATLRGHEKEISAVAYSPDASRIVTASWDNTAKIWDSSNGQLIATLRGHESEVWAVTYSPGSSQIATASRDNTARIWDAVTGDLIVMLAGHENLVYSIVYSPDGSQVATASWDSTARVWDSLTGELISTLKAHESEVWAVVYSSDGSRILTTGSDNTARIWDASTAELIAVLTGHEDVVYAATYSPSGSHITTASWDNTARVWDSSTGRLTATLKGHSNFLWAVVYSPDGSRIVTASRDKTVKIWTAPVDGLIGTVHGHAHEVIDLVYSPDGSRIATASRDGTAKVWDATTGELITTLNGHQNEVHAVTYSPNGSRIATASWDKTARVWDPTTGELITTLRGHTDVIWAVVYSPDGSFVATASSDNTAKIWDATTGTLITSLNGHESLVYDIAYSPDGSRIATASWDNTARIWNSSTGEAAIILSGHGGAVHAIAYAADGSHVATTSADDSTRIWDAFSGKVITALEGHGNEVWGVAYSPDGFRIATISRDNTAKIWEVYTGKLIATLEGHDNEVWGVAYSPNGQLVATASSDNTARIWDSSSGKCIRILEGHLGVLNYVIFSPDGTQLATTSDDHTAKIWDPLTGKILADLKDRIGIRQADGSIDWPVPPSTLTHIGCQRLQPFEGHYTEVVDLCNRLLGL